MLIRYEFIDDNGAVLHTAIGEVETQTFIDRCVKTEVEELKKFDPVNLLCRKLF